MIDILLQPDGDLMITAGDFTAGGATVQHQSILLVAQPGEFKQSPKTGVGIGDLLLGDNLLEYRHKIRQQFTGDGMEVKKLELYNIDDFEIDAEYKDH